LRDRRGLAVCSLQKTADAKFRLASNSFDVFHAVTHEIAAVQRGWRDFRIAP
jgi:hypothetical protein